jgi:HEAT repeat protein
VQRADWHLRLPALYLDGGNRLGDWVDEFFAWVTAFYIPELRYHRRPYIAPCDELVEKLKQLEASRGREEANRVAYRRLLGKFRRELPAWDEKQDALENLESDMRCGTCGPQGNHRHRRARHASDSPREAFEALQRSIAEDPEQANSALWLALRNPKLESLRPNVLLEVRELGEQALPLAQAVVPFLDGRKSQAPEMNCAAYALAAMGPGADVAIREWMEQTPVAAWEAGLAALFYPLGEERSVELLRTALRSDNGDAKLSACKSIATEVTHSWEALLPDLVDTLAEGDAWVRSAAVDALVGIGPEALETMWALTQSPNALVRVAGLEALGKYAAPSPGTSFGGIDVGGREPLSLLAGMLKDAEPTVRVAAAAALQKIAVALSNSTLAAEMKSAEPELQAAIAKGYQECVVHQSGDRRLREAIREQIPRLTASPMAMRQLAAADLVISSDTWPDKSSPLYAALMDWHEPRRAEYLEAIRLAGPRAKGLMEGILVCTAADPPVQVAALRALGAMGEEASAEAIDRTSICLESAHLEVRKAAADALGNFGPASKWGVVMALHKALLDDERMIGREACEALGKMKKLANDAVADIGARATRLGPVAIDALAGIGTQDARQEVLRLYQRYADVADDDDDVWIRDEARAWLMRWGMITSDQNDATRLNGRAV